MNSKSKTLITIGLLTLAGTPWTWKDTLNSELLGVFSEGSTQLTTPSNSQDTPSDLTDTFDTTETFNGTENTEKEAKTPIKAPSNIAQELGNPEFIALGEKLIAENLDGVPEVDQQKFIETAWILIQNRNAGKSTPIIIIIRNNGMVDYGKQLGKITNDRYNGAVDIQTATNTQLETTNTELKATNAKLKATNAELWLTMTESCLNAEKAVVSLLRTHKDTPPEQIIKEFGDQIKVIINMFIKYKHPVDRDIYVWLQKLGIPTQWLEIKEDKIALL